MSRNKSLAVMCVPWLKRSHLVIGGLIVGWRMAGMLMPHAAAGAVIRPWRRRCS
jgi:hypothetical protein